MSETSLTQVISELSSAEGADRVRALLAALEQMPVGVIVVEPPTGRISLYNRRAEEILGHAVRPAEAIEDYASYGGVHRDGRPYASEDYPTARALLHGHVILNEPLTYRRPDGDVRELSVSAVPIRTEDGLASSVVCTFGDVTEVTRSRAILAFHAESSRLLVDLVSSTDMREALQQLARAAVESLADCCVIDLRHPDGTYERAAVAHALPDVDGTAQRLRDFPPRTSRQVPGRVTEEGVEVLIAEVTAMDIAASTPSDDGHRELLEALHPTSFMSVPLHASERNWGALTLFQTHAPRRFTASDLSWLRGAGRQIGSSIAIVRALSDREAARRQAEAANRAKDEFLAVLGHELRNPLAPLSSALQLTRMRSADKLTDEHVVMERQVKHLTRLVDDLLDVSRLIRGKVVLEKAEVLLADVLRDAIEVASPLLDERGHDVEIAVHDADAVVHGDAGRLVQVFANLLTNAAKFTPTGGRVHVQTARDGETLTVEVRDSGVGIEPGLLARMFEPFVQKEGAQVGLGLGLAIVRGLVDQHGGRVEAFSAGSGTGSTFRVSLPRAHTRKSVRIITAPPAVAVEAPQTIVVVDDNEDAAELLARYLRARGHRVHVFFDPVDALASAPALEPQFALLDIGLPAMSGYELAARLKERGLLETRFVAITGYARPRERAEDDFEAYLVKPVKLQELTALLGSMRLGTLRS